MDQEPNGARSHLRNRRASRRRANGRHASRGDANRHDDASRRDGTRGVRQLCLILLMYLPRWLT